VKRTQTAKPNQARRHYVKQHDYKVAQSEPLLLIESYTLPESLGNRTPLEVPTAGRSVEAGPNPAGLNKQQSERPNAHILSKCSAHRTQKADEDV
jgi:hypothetical protein